jgi:hypothetical protein
LLEELTSLWTNIETHPAIRNAFFVICNSSLRILVEFIGNYIVNGEYELDVVFLGLFDEAGDLFRAWLIE